MKAQRSTKVSSHSSVPARAAGLGLGLAAMLFLVASGASKGRSDSAAEATARRDGTQKLSADDSLPGLSMVTHLYLLDPPQILKHLHLSEPELAALDEPGLRALALRDVEQSVSEFISLSYERDQIATSIARALVESETFVPNAAHQCNRADGFTAVLTPAGSGFLAHSDYPDLEAVANRLRRLPGDLRAGIAGRITSDVLTDQPSE